MFEKRAKQAVIRTKPAFYAVLGKNNPVFRSPGIHANTGGGGLKTFGVGQRTGQLAAKAPGAAFLNVDEVIGHDPSSEGCFYLSHESQKVSSPSRHLRFHRPYHLISRRLCGNPILQTNQKTNASRQGRNFRWLKTEKPAVLKSLKPKTKTA
jgi:hypothetical protein